MRFALNDTKPSALTVPKGPCPLTGVSPDARYAKIDPSFLGLEFVAVVVPGRPADEVQNPVSPERPAARQSRPKSCRQRYIGLGCVSQLVVGAWTTASAVTENGRFSLSTPVKRALTTRCPPSTFTFRSDMPTAKRSGLV